MAEKFEFLRQRAKQDVNKQTQGRQNALKRRFAALGQGTSGAAVKLEQQAQREGSQEFGRRAEAIDLAESTDKSRKDEIKAGRAFQTSERAASQGFAAEQAKLGREFQSQERGTAQDFAASQAALGRGQQSEQFTKQFDAQTAQFKKTFDESFRQYNENFDQAVIQFETQFGEELRINNANLDTAEKVFKENSKKGSVDTFFGEIGKAFKF